MQRQFLASKKERAKQERIVRVLRAYEWTVATRRVQSVDNEIEHKRTKYAGLDKSKKKLLKDLKLAEKGHEDVKARREAELRKGGKLKKPGEGALQVPDAGRSYECKHCQQEEEYSK